MAQHDHNIANQTFPDFRTDLNNLAAAVQSMNSGTTAPTSPVAGMLWYDTTNSLIKQYNGSTWVTIFAYAQPLVGQSGSQIYASDGGGSDSYAITLSPVPTAYVTGMVVRFRANTANTGACSLNVNSLGAKTIKKNFNTDLADNDILANQLVEVIYDGTNFQLLSPVANVATTVSAATQAEMEAASSTTVFASPGRLQYHPGVAKFWVNFNTVTTTSINASHNVASLTDNGTGDTTINFTTSFSSANYAAAVLVRSEGAGGNGRVAQVPNTTAPTSSALRLVTSAGTGAAADMPNVFCVGFGDQ